VEALSVCHLTFRFPGNSSKHDLRGFPPCLPPTPLPLLLYTVPVIRLPPVFRYCVLIRCAILNSDLSAEPRIRRRLTRTRTLPTTSLHLFSFSSRFYGQPSFLPKTVVVRSVYPSPRLCFSSARAIACTTFTVLFLTEDCQFLKPFILIFPLMK